MTKLLDLRKKSFDKVKVVEHIIFKPRSFKVEMIKMFSIIAIVTAIGFGISSANDLVEKQTLQQAPTKNFSAIGTVSEINPSSISIVDAKGSNDKSQTSYTFDTSPVLKIETKTYVPLTLSDILVGDRIVVQGLDQDGTISIRRIISFTATSSREIIPDVATSTATTTVETSTTTDSSGSTVTEVSTTTDATSTPSIIETITDTVGNIVDKAKETIQNVVDTVTGTEQTTNAPEVVTPPTTETTLTPEVISTVEPAPQTTPTPEPTPTPESQAPPADPSPTQ